MAKPSVSSLTEGHNKDVTIEDLSAQIEILKNDLATLTHTISDFGAAKTQYATEAARAKAAELSAAGREKAAASYGQAEDFVRTQPATAVGIAAGIGFLVGMLTTARR